MFILKNTFKLAALFFIYATTLLPVTLSAENLYTTDDYLNGLDDEISSPDYIKKAKQDLRETEMREQAENASNTDILKALISMYNFEALIRTKYPSAHSVYSKLSISARVLIFDEFKKTQKLSVAKRLIIEKYLAK